MTYRARIVIAVSLCVVNVVLFSLHVSRAEGPHEFVHGRALRLLILAPHQDDGVIMAAGLAQQNLQLGGTVTVAYLTVPEQRVESEIRRQEAIDAWSRIDVLESALIFPPQIDIDAIAHQDEMEIWIRRIIHDRNIDTVIAPILEYGNRDHDKTFELAQRISNAAGLKSIRFASLYNPIYIIEENPQKVVEFVRRLLPFVSYSNKFPGIHVSNQEKLKMSEAEREIKRPMLLTFESQLYVIPLEQFDYADTFEEPQVTDLYKIHSKYFSFQTLLMFALFLLAVSMVIWTVPGVAHVAIGALGVSLIVELTDARMFIEEFALLSVVSALILVFEVISKLTLRR